MELSGTLGSSKRHWSNVHNDIKSTNVDWLMVFGMEGKSGGVLVPVRMELSGPPTGVAAVFSCPADPPTPAVGRGAGPSESSGSSKRNWELCDDSTTETSAGLSVCIHCDRAVTCGRAVPCCRAVPCGWAVACGRAVTCGRVVACGRAVEPSATGAGTGTAGADSKWICRPGEATTVIVRFSGALGFAGDSWTSRLATNVPPVLSELSRRLSRWLGWDLRSGDARDEEDERDRRSPEEWRWWWREEELDGRVSDAFETLPDSARLR